MSALLIENAEGIFTGLPGEAMRAQGSIRIRDGVITAIGALTPESGERRLDASGCVIYPGLISTHHHLFQSVLKGVQSGINQPLSGWLRSVPYAYWSKIDEEALAVAARIGLAELLLSGTTTVADHHYLFSDTYRFDPAAVIFEVARSLGLRLVLCRGGGTKTSHIGGGDGAPTPIEPLERMLASVEACAQRFHDPSPAGLTKVAMAPDDADLVTRAGPASRGDCRLASHEAAAAQPPVGNVGLCRLLHVRTWQTSRALACRPRLARSRYLVRAHGASRR
ncbi:cytosine/adenosine deaminase-related metal-dependent hydrolase [Bradyrhizobium diazoefficiens]